MSIKSSAPTEVTVDALNEKELFCIARHIQQHVEDEKYERIADSAGACKECKYAISGTCTDYPNLSDPWPSFRKLDNLTGVSISPLIKRDMGHRANSNKLGSR